MRASIHLLSLTLIVALSTGACRPSQGGSDSSVRDDDVTVRIVTPEVNVVGPATLIVSVERGGEPISGATVEVTGDMTHAGMVPVVSTTVEHEPGRYRTDDFRFAMAGDWIVSAVATLTDGRTVRAEMATTVRLP